jgi:hypothetical protein
MKPEGDEMGGRHLPDNAGIRDQPTPGGPRPIADPAAENESVLRRQAQSLILGIISDPDTGSDARISLVRHLKSYPGNPVQALLAHIRDRQDPPGMPTRVDGNGAAERPPG